MISYSTKESPEKVLKLVDLLTKAGFPLWFDANDDIKYGNGIWRKMKEGVENSVCVILIYSDLYRQSVYCEFELECMKFLGRAIFPVISPFPANKFADSPYEKWLIKEHVYDKRIG